MADNITTQKLEMLREKLAKVQMQKETSAKVIEGGNSDSEEVVHHVIDNGSYVRIADDKMSAWLYLNPPGEAENHFSRSTICEFIEEFGVKTGFHESNISAIAKKHVYEREILVAKGKAPVAGIDGKYEFFFSTNGRKKPLIREDGTCDYSAMNEITNVKKGDTVAIYHPAEPGSKGYDIFGTEIVVKQPRELPKLKGRGVSNEEDPNVYVAVMEGKVEFRDNRIDIKNVHEVKGDVDLVTKRVEFFGDIHICGNVGTGVTIRASRNVEIDGVVEGAFIYAGGDVVIKRGIQGGTNARINVKGNLSAEFIEYCTVNAKGNVRANYIMNSDIVAGGIVLAEGSRGSVIGGNVRGIKGVKVKDIGNDVEVKTIVGAGYSADDYQMRVEARLREEEVKRQLSDTVDELTKLVREKKLGKRLDKTAEERIAKLTEARDACFEELETVRQKEEELSKIIEDGKGSFVSASNFTYRGSVVCVEGNPLLIQSNLPATKFRNDNGRVAVSPIR